MDRVPWWRAHRRWTTGASRFANAAAERRHSGRDADRRACRVRHRRKFRRRTILRIYNPWRTIAVAARLEAANKRLGTRICTSATIAKAGDFRGRPVGDLVLRGKSEALRTFEPLRIDDDAALKSYLDRIRRPASLRRRPSLKFGTPGLARRHLPGASASLIALAAIGRRSAIAMECSS
jgi:hypothetical protein